ncbi:sensor histidine kinase [Pedobacter sp. JCM 36344]|uniref:sensor histidine kinase n=1 Tax=Pedobacter sp. JCM 36344 TaxID=3374280 RepID=UPI00397C0C17
MPKPALPTIENPPVKKESFWFGLIGSPAAFSLESRIFHSISVSLVFLSWFYTLYNLYAGLYVGSLSGFLFSLLFLHQYYQSRYRARAHNNIVFGLAGLLIFGLNYFSNSGIDGSTDLIWPTYLLLVFAITPYRQHLLWLAIYLLTFFILHLVEFYYPSLVQHPFEAGKGQFIDRVTAFPIPAISIYIIIKFLRKSYDKERNAADERAVALEQSSIEKNRMMSIISHDLRSPLMNVQGYLQLLNGNDLEESERIMMQKALLTSTNNAMEMLSNLLHWSKSQMEGANVYLLELNLADSLFSTIEMEQANALKKGISLACNIPREIVIVADLDMLQIVVRNLINNAVKFTAEGGVITIDAAKVKDECKITIADNGNGISEEKQGIIFSMNAEPSLGTNNERGVGLGLVLCKEFIERQKGRISFESQQGKGSNFFVFLPLKS